MNIAVLNKAEVLLAEAYGGPEAAIGGEFGKILLDMLLGLLSTCTGAGGTPVSILKLARSNNAKDVRATELLVDRSVRKGLRERFGLFGYARQGGEKITATYIKAVRAKDDDGEYKVMETDLADLVELAA